MHSLTTATEDVPAEAQLETPQPVMNEPLVETEAEDESHDSAEKETASPVSTEEAGGEGKEITSSE